MMLDWRQVVEWEGAYEVSRCGVVKSVARVVTRSNGRLHPVRERILKQNVNSNNYPCVTLQRPHQKLTLPVYQLVSRAFLGPTPEGREICHGPLGKSVSDVSNLYFGTHQQNGLDMLRDGLKSCKPILINGCLFRSINEAARYLGVDASNLSNSLHKGWKCAGFDVKFESV